jgi:two-component system, OmpR family, response regulator
MENWKVLLVDDEVEFVSTLAERLRLRGIQTQTANDGEEAFRQIASDPPQVVVLDVMMPGMGGLKVLERIKADYPGMPVILLTGIGTTKDGAAGMRLGAFDYLMKPLQIEDLIERIGQALKGSGGAA